MRLAEPFRQLGRAQGALAHRLEHHLAVRARGRTLRVLVHQRGEQRAIERAPVDADPHRLAVGDRNLDHAAEVLVVLVADPDVAGIDAVLVERFRARRVLGEEHVPVVVEVADDRGCDPEIANAPDHFGNGGRRLARVDRDAHELGSGGREERDLGGGGCRVLGVGVGHGLDRHGIRSADGHAADAARHAAAARGRKGVCELNERHAPSIGAGSKARQTRTGWPGRSTRDSGREEAG